MKTSFDELRNRAFNKRILLMLLVMLMSVTGAWAQQTFISEVKISAEEGGSTNKQRLKDDGYNLIDQDLNANEGGRDIYLGYKTTTNAAEAITGLLIVESSSSVDVRENKYKNTPITYRGKKYYRCDHYGSDYVDCDLNRKSGGADITLYYTKDGNTNDGANLLTEFTTVTNNTDKSGYTYVRHWKYDSDMYSTTNNDVYGNTNEDNGSYKIYLIYKFHTHNVTATFNWSADGNTCTANMSCDCGMKSTNVQCNIIQNQNTATCTTDGTKNCTAKVTRHGKEFVSDARDFFASRLGHDMVHHAMVEATCVKDGHSEYWTCSHSCCDGSILYKDAEGTEIYTEFPVIPNCPAPYIDAEGLTKYNLIDGEITSTNTTTTLNTGWYIVLGENVQTRTLVCEGAVNIILADDAKLTAMGANWDAGIRVSAEGASLTIYGQKDQSGQLIAKGNHHGAGIGGGENGSAHDITINGGVITATGGYDAAGIGGGYEASGNNITINGGVIAATGGGDASAIGGGWPGSSSNIHVNSSLVLYADGNNPPTTFIEHTNDTDVSGSLSGKRYVIVRKPTLGITITFDKQGGTGGTEQVTAYENEEMPIIEVPTLEGYNFQGYYAGENGAGIKYYNADGTSAHLWNKAENTTLYAYWKETVAYIDADGTEKSVYVYEEINSSTKTLTGGWYIVRGADVRTQTLVCEGDVNLILADGAKLTSTGELHDAGIRVSAESASLTIYGQQNQTGQLIATGSYDTAGIGGGYKASGNNITINGGVITATGGSSGAGIGGGYKASGNNITINGGVITVAGGDRSPAIGGGYNGSASNIFVNAAVILNADENATPTTEIEHTSSEDLASALRGKRYATLALPSVTVNRAPELDANFSTFYHKYADYTVPNEDATIYTAAVEDYQGETCLVLREIEGGVIPANTAVILRTEESTTIDLQPCADASGITVPANSLSGANLPMDAPDFCYILSYGQHGLGFYKYAEGNALAAHKAYLTYQHGAAEARALRMVFADDNEVDGIESVNDDDTLRYDDDNIYSISGVRLNKLQKGINIVNGKKVVVK